MKWRQAVALGLLPGLLLFAVLFSLGTLSLSREAEQPDPDTLYVMQAYAAKVWLTLLRIGLLHLWTGIVLGGACGLTLRLLYPRLTRNRAVFSLASFALLALFCAYLTARLLIRQPSFFDRFLLAQGGPGRSLQLFLTDDVGLRLLDGAAAVLLLALLLASRRVLRLLSLRSPLRRSQVVFVLVLLTIGLSATVRMLWSPPRPERPDRFPNILLLAVDSLRLDHLSLSGYPRNTSPHLDGLARNSRVFRDAYVPVARTLPSWTSLLTSAWPHSHGLRHMFPESARRSVPLPTLPEVLSQHGYRSAVVSDFAGEMFDLVDLGYDLVDTPPASDMDVLVQRQMLLHFPLMLPFVNHRLGKRALPVLSYLTVNADARSLARRALRRMRELADSGPFFMTVFFSTTHAPYASPWPYYRRFTDPEYDGPHRYALAIRDPRELVDGEPQFDEADRRQVIALYDGAVASVDDAIGEILTELADWEFLDSTLILVTADHGEHLFEAGNTLDHGKWFRGGEKSNHVPLLLHEPGGALGTGPVDGLVRTIDLMPTLLARLGIPVPGTCEGVDLGPFLRGQEPLPELSLFAETGVWLKAPTTFRREPDALIYPPINELLVPDPFDDSLVVAAPFRDRIVEAKHRLLLDGHRKLVYEPTEDGVVWRFEDPRQPEEQRRDLADREAGSFAEYRERLLRWMQEDPTRRLDRRGHLLPW